MDASKGVSVNSEPPHRAPSRKLKYAGSYTADPPRSDDVIADDVKTDHANFNGKHIDAQIILRFLVIDLNGNQRLIRIPKAHLAGMTVQDLVVAQGIVTKHSM